MAAATVKGLKGALTKADVDVKTPSGKKSAIRAIDPTDTVIEVERETDGKTSAEDIKVKAAITDYVQKLKTKKAAEEAAAEAADVVRFFVGLVRTDNARQGDYQKTYRLMGNKGQKTEYAVDVSENDKWSVSKELDLNDKKTREALIEKIGQEDFDKLFEELTTIGIKKEILNNEALRKELSATLFKLLGKDGIKKFFRRETVWTVKKGTEKLQYELPEETVKEFKKIATQAADTVKDASKPIT
ncbi:MAG: hypothetical protein GF334_04470 [Candidatus Altiarchaeales archaeon]|nr:hypothetical protein [Candidatus Altiarchaeales archaeon]